MRHHAMGLLLLAVGLATLGGTASAQRPLVEEVVALDNDSVRIVQLTYHPGADSDLHLNLGPEITLVQQGELALYTQKGREPLGPGAVHFLPTSNAHLARNEGTQPVRFWSLLLKKCD
jgi:quercetin dioxygenase-like cupin family protein